jgi:hypothetical protein
MTAWATQRDARHPTRAEIICHRKMMSLAPFAKINSQILVNTSECYAMRFFPQRISMRNVTMCDLCLLSRDGPIRNKMKLAPQRLLLRPTFHKKFIWNPFRAETYERSDIFATVSSLFALLLACVCSYCSVTHFVAEGRITWCPSLWPGGLWPGYWPLEHWDRGFESHLNRGYLSSSLSVVLFCVGRVLATGRHLS